MALRGTQDALILETPGSSGHLRGTQDVLIIESGPFDFGHLRSSQDVLILECNVPIPPLAPNPYKPMSYPLVIPGAIGPSKANLKKYDAVGEFLSPFDGSGSQQQNQDQHWELDLVWPEMTWKQFAVLDAFSGGLHGKWGTFLWGPPLATGPQGTALGMPVTSGAVISGANASGVNQLSTAGWLPSESGLLLPGDFLQIGPWGQFPVVAVQVITFLVGGISDTTLYVTVAGNLTTAQQALLESGPVGFTGLTAAVWMNGWLFEVTSISAGATSVISFNPVPVGGSGGQIPTLYALTADTGSTMMGHSRLHQYVNPNPLMSDGGGNALLDLFPNIRESPPDGTPVTLLFAQGEFRLAENRRESPADRTKSFTFQLKAREAI